MEELGIIVVILLIIVLGIFIEFRGTCDGLNFILYCAGIALTVILTLSFFDIFSPRAIDVYQGKTTLEITYRDSIPVDSVVVFKNIN